MTCSSSYEGISVDTFSICSACDSPVIGYSAHFVIIVTRNTHLTQIAYMTTRNIISVTELPIRLGQFLKYANLVQDGFEAKIQIQHGEVCLNGQIETQRGKQLAAGDVITYQGEDYYVETADK